MRMIEFVKRWWLPAGLALAFALRCGYSAYAYRYVKPDQPRMEVVDPESYDRMALQLLDHHAFLGPDGKPMTDREPLYPLILAAAHLVFGRSPAVGMALNVAAGVVTCWLIYALTLELFGDPWAARLAFAAACVFPEWVYYDGVMFREPLVTALLVLWAWAWFARERWGLPRSFLIAGLCYGAITVIRSPFVPLGAAFWLMAGAKLPRRVWSRTLGVFALCTVLFQAPWVARNYLITGRLVAGATMGGSQMYLSLKYDYAHPEVPLEAPLNGSDPVVRAVFDRGLTLGQGEPIFYRGCWDIFIHRPGVFWGAFLHKVIKMWRFYPNVGWNYGYSLWLLTIVGALSNGGLIAAGLLGFWLALRRGTSLDFLVLTPALMTVVFGLFWAVTRYHSPLMFVFMPCAGLAARGLLGESA